MAPSVGRVVHFFPETWGLGGDHPPVLALVGGVEAAAEGERPTCALLVCEVGKAPGWRWGVREGREYGEPGTWSWPPKT